MGAADLPPQHQTDSTATVRTTADADLADEAAHTRVDTDATVDDEATRVHLDGELDAR